MKKNKEEKKNIKYVGNSEDTPKEVTDSELEQQEEERIEKVIGEILEADAPDENAEPLEIKVKYHSDEPVEIKEIEIGDWIDIPLQEDFKFYGTKDFFEVNLGVSMEIPKGYEAHLIVRSSTFEHWGLIQTNGMGIIDNSYAGNGDVWKLPVYRLGKHYGNKIPKGTRLAQFRIMKKQPDVVLTKVDDLGNEDRGGLGSTGK